MLLGQLPWQPETDFRMIPYSLFTPSEPDFHNSVAESKYIESAICTVLLELPMPPSPFPWFHSLDSPLQSSRDPLPRLGRLRPPPEPGGQ